VGDREVVALTLADGPGPYPVEVRHRIRSEIESDYAAVAVALNESGVKAVSVQHEYGIWGGPEGSFVLDFVRRLRKPFVATLHTVLRNPSPLQKAVLAELVDTSAVSVVMSGAAATRLTQAYDVDPARLEVVPHGVPAMPLAEPATAKLRLGLRPGPVILSFGLLGPGKGYESAIGAMPAVVGRFPSARFVVLGATHPDLLRREGEAYRRRLEGLAATLGVAGSVQFVDRFVAKSELGLWLQAADVFVTPYPNLDQIVSGTLSYAMGAGKAIVSTPYAYAEEMLENGRGLLVRPGSPDALAEAFLELLADDALRARLGWLAYRRSRSMLWPTVAERYRAIFDRVAAVKPVVAANQVGVLHG
jgi:glycosyltransferase involved in cell wall biosynthesis